VVADEDDLDPRGVPWSRVHDIERAPAVRKGKAEQVGCVFESARKVASLDPVASRERIGLQPGLVPQQPFAREGARARPLVLVPRNAPRQEITPQRGAHLREPTYFAQAGLASVHMTPLGVAETFPWRTSSSTQVRTVV